MSRTALTVHGFRPDSPLSPFFGKARYVLIVDSGETPISFTQNRAWTQDWVCRTIAKADVERVICGFIDSDSLQLLQEASIDVRVGPCSIPAIHLLQEFTDLPRAEKPGGDKARLYLAQDNSPRSSGSS